MFSDSPRQNNSKKKRVEVSPPTALYSSPIVPASATAMATTPEALREMPQTSEAALNISALPTDLRHLSKTDDASDANEAIYANAT